MYFSETIYMYKTPEYSTLNYTKLITLEFQSQITQTYTCIMKWYNKISLFTNNLLNLNQLTV
jgi:hypothetical protein